MSDFVSHIAVFGDKFTFMFAVIETGGKQYKVAIGDKIEIESLPGDVSSMVIFDKVLLTNNDGAVEVGQPCLPSVKIEGKILEQGREDKKIVFRYHSKTRYRKKKGHRQNFTRVEVTAIRI